MRGSVLGGLLAALALLPACAPPVDVPPPVPVPPDPQARTHWELRHRVADVRGMQVVEQSLGDSEEHTGLQLTDPATRRTDDCFVSVEAPGQGGPENRVGAKIATTFDGRPAVRSGAGAEADYLMWSLTDGSWVSVDCSRPDARAQVDLVAAAVQLEPTTLRVPVRVDVPRGLRPTIVSVDLRVPAARIYLSAAAPSTPRWDLVIMVGAPELSPAPEGEATTIGGRPALVDDDEQNPVVWLREQDRWIYVGASSSDTGPNPDRAGELPTIRALAESLTAADDLTDPRTWFSADNVFG